MKIIGTLYPMLTREIAIRISLNAIEERMNFIQGQLDELAQGIKNEGKSSAGDKHETSISMMQLEQEKLGEQIQLVIEQKNQLSRLLNLDPSTKAGNGRLIITNLGSYFLATSLGKMSWENEEFFTLSVQSPFGQILIGKEKGSNFSYNGKNYSILNVE
jgi:hypothetical protein